MCPRSSAVLLLLATALAWPAGAARADDVERYLERHGLTRLLVRHLERTMDDLQGDARSDALRRLADLYAQLLELEPDSVRRADLEERSRRLVAQARTCAEWAADRLGEVDRGRALAVAGLARLALGEVQRTEQDVAEARRLASTSGEYRLASCRLLLLRGDRAGAILSAREALADERPEPRRTFRTFARLDPALAPLLQEAR